MRGYGLVLLGLVGGAWAWRWSRADPDPGPRIKALLEGCVLTNARGEKVLGSELLERAPVLGLYVGCDAMPSCRRFLGKLQAYWRDARKQTALHEAEHGARPGRESARGLRADPYASAPAPEFAACVLQDFVVDGPAPPPGTRGQTPVPVSAMVYVGCDEKAEDWRAHLKHMPRSWYAVPFENRQLRRDLMRELQCWGKAEAKRFGDQEHFKPPKFTLLTTGTATSRDATLAVKNFNHTHFKVKQLKRPLLGVGDDEDSA